MVNVELIPCIHVVEDDGEDRKGPCTSVRQPQHILNQFIRHRERLSASRHRAFKLGDREPRCSMVLNNGPEIPQQGVQARPPDAADDQRSEYPGAQQQTVRRMRHAGAVGLIEAARMQVICDWDD